MDLCTTGCNIVSELFLYRCKVKSSQFIRCGINLKSRKTRNNNSSTTGSELWRKAGQSAFQLQENMLKSDNI